MSEQQLVSIVTSIVRDTGRPANSTAIAMRFGYISDRQVRTYLSRFEGLAVQRVGQRRGWLPLAA